VGKANGSREGAHRRVQLRLRSDVRLRVPAIQDEFVESWWVRRSAPFPT